MTLVVDAPLTPNLLLLPTSAAMLARNGYFTDGGTYTLIDKALESDTAARKSSLPEVPRNCNPMPEY